MIYGVATLAACMLLGTVIGTVFGNLIRKKHDNTGKEKCRDQSVSG